MGTNRNYYLSKIKEDLSLKQRMNPLYSLRAYARDLGVHPATLSQVLKGKRPLPLKDSTHVLRKLNLGPKESTLFMESILSGKASLDQIKLDESDERFMLDESHFKIISEWEHYAVLELFNLQNFRASNEEIAFRLNLTMNRVDVVIQNLLVAGLIVRNHDETYRKIHEDVRTTENISSPALRASHRETVRMSLEKLEEIDLELRDFSSSTLALDPEKLPEAKTIIREFRKKMAALLRDGEKSEVYQLAIQFFPVTKTVSKQHDKMEHV